MNKVIYDEALKELIKGMNDFSVEMTKLEASQKPSVSKELKGYVKRYMWYNSMGHKSS